MYMQYVKRRNNRNKSECIFFNHIALYTLNPKIGGISIKLPAF